MDGKKPVEEKALIPFKSINLSLVQKRIDKALAKTRDHFNTESTGEGFQAFAMLLFTAFPASVRFDVFFASIMHLAGVCLTREVIYNNVWRLAGCITKLKKGMPVPPWTRQTELEWCPVVITKASPGRGYDGKMGFFYDYRVLGGQPAGLKFTTFWSLKYARFVARSIGFRRTRKAHFKLTDGSELVRMRLYLLFDPKLSKEDRPVAYHFYVPSSFRTYNQKILKQRYRIIPCPLAYLRTEMACHHCPKGYDECPAACHPKTFTAKACPRCGEQETWFDPQGRGVICVACDETEKRQRVR